MDVAKLEMQRAANLIAAAVQHCFLTGLVTEQYDPADAFCQIEFIKLKGPDAALLRAKTKRETVLVQLPPVERDGKQYAPVLQSFLPQTMAFQVPTELLAEWKTAVLAARDGMQEALLEMYNGGVCPVCGAEPGDDDEYDDGDDDDGDDGGDDDEVPEALEPEVLPPAQPAPAKKKAKS